MFTKVIHKGKQVAYDIVAGFVFSLPLKRVLIVKLDAIGDYVLFRNGLTTILECDRFKGHQFYLLGNRLWRNLAETFDSHPNLNFIWINPGVLYNRQQNKFSRTYLLFKLKLLRFGTIINPVHSRLLDIDYFIRDIGSESRIASTGDDINYQYGEKQSGDACYTKLINVSDYTVFEFFRNLDFIYGLTDVSTNNIELKINHQKKISSELNVVIAPGAGHARRQWPASHFASTIMSLGNQFLSIKFYICGSYYDKIIAEDIIKLCVNVNIFNLTGTQSLTQFVTTLQNASLLISNESSAVHLAAAVELPAVCISNGNMYGRFNPYPSKLKKLVVTLYPDLSFYDPECCAKNTELYKVESQIDIAKIDPELVSVKCTAILSMNSCL